MKSHVGALENRVYLFVYLLSRAFLINIIDLALLAYSSCLPLFLSLSLISLTSLTIDSQANASWLDHHLCTVQLCAYSNIWLVSASFHQFCVYFKNKNLVHTTHTRTPNSSCTWDKSQTTYTSTKTTTTKVEDERTGVVGFENLISPIRWWRRRMKKRYIRILTCSLFLDKDKFLNESFFLSLRLLDCERANETIH